MVSRAIAVALYRPTIHFTSCLEAQEGNAFQPARDETLAALATFGYKSFSLALGNLSDLRRFVHDICVSRDCYPASRFIVLHTRVAARGRERSFVDPLSVSAKGIAHLLLSANLQCRRAVG